MLSRVAQAPRLGLTAARLSTSSASFAASSPLLRSRLATASLSPWIRSYAKNTGNSSKSFKPAPKPASKPSQPKPAPKPSPSQSAAAAAAAEQGAPKETSKAASQQPPKEDVAGAQEPVAPESTKDAEEMPFHKLPDLTQGIPSTLEYEMEDKPRAKSDSALQAVDPESSRRGGDGGANEYVSTNERNRRWWTRFLLTVTAVGGSFGIVHMGRNWEDEIEASRHPDIPNGWSPILWWQRTRARWGESVSYYQDPEFEKLLPDPDPSFERPYTLCLSLDDLLVHSEWSREHGWRLAKRPGMDYFIRYLSQYYELVLFTTVPFMMGEPLVRKLDPFRFIIWPLYREATKYEDGEIVKDLSYLNRDLSKVIILDTESKHVRKQPENAIVLDPWKGAADDKELVGLIPLLEYIHTMQYSDVRKVIKSFEGKHIPTEFARREAIARKEFNKQVEAEKSKHSKPSGMGALGNLLGMKPSNMSMTMSPEGEQSPSEAFAQGKMLQDIARERGQRNYQLLEREIRENGEKWLKEEAEAMEKANQEAMSSMMGSFSGWFVPKKEDKKEDKTPPPADKKA